MGVDVNRALIIPKLKIITKACVLYDRAGEKIGKECNRMKNVLTFNSDWLQGNYGLGIYSTIVS